MGLIKQATSLSHVFDELLPQGPEDWLLLDVDGTLIHPTDAIFQAPKSVNRFSGFLDEYKDLIKLSEKGEGSEFQQVLSAFRRDRNVTVVDSLWLELFKRYHDVGAKILGLTKIDTGSFGSLPSVEKWRFKELAALGLSFSLDDFPSASEPLVVFETDCSFPATFFQGILFTGNASKAEALQGFMKACSMQPKSIRFVDDKRSNLVELQAYCGAKEIPYLGIEYQQINSLEAPAFSEKRAAFQVDYLHKHKKWLSDQEADEKLKTSTE